MRSKSCRLVTTRLNTSHGCSVESPVLCCPCPSGWCVRVSAPSRSSQDYAVVPKPPCTLGPQGKLEDCRAEVLNPGVAGQYQYVACEELGCATEGELWASE